MGRIIELPSELVEKIAAGEVIERPASVVKELIENSIDAEATNIAIDIVDSGLKEIRVIDNGIGMSKEDAILSVKRHTTSKIHNLEDLHKIRTLGFRGEALASISAVSKLTIITKTEDDQIGTRIYVEASDIKSIEPIGCPVGTTVIVRDLFYNVPARKKFLKSKKQELSYIIDIVTRYALINEKIGFTLRHNGRVIISSPSANDILEKILHIYGREIASNMIKVELHRDYLGIRGYTSKPFINRASRSNMNIYVNKRYIYHRVLYKAVEEAYFTLLPEGKYPICVINLEIDPALIDVNIHPTKREIRFYNDSDVFNFVRDAIRETLLQERLIPEIEIKKSPASQIQKNEVTKSLKERIPVTPKVSPKKIRANEALLTDFLTMETKKMPFTEKGWKILGQVNDLFIIATDDTDIFIIDQHAAHERIQFEKFYKEFQSKNIKRQELIEPIIIEFNPREMQTIRNNIEYLEKLGFTIEMFGDQEILVRSVPVIIKKVASKEVLKELLDEFLSLGNVKLGRLPPQKDVIALIACKSAIKAGKKLLPYEMVNLINELLRCEDPYTCPHGRPTILVLQNKTLLKYFKRI